MSLLRRLGIFIGLLSPVLLTGCGPDYQTVRLVAGAVSLPTGLTDSLIAPIPAPTSIARLTDGRTLVGSQGGSLYLIDTAGVKQTAPVVTFTDICANSERGLLGVAGDPAFGSNGFVYLYVTRDIGNGCKNSVSRFTMTGGTINLATELPLLANIPSPGSNHNGGDVHFGKDGFLYVSVGDGGSTPLSARSTNIVSGKILRIASDGSIPPGNMFPGGARCNTAGQLASGQNCAEIYALGLRNPFRIVPDNNASGTRFLINDVGQNTQEEVNVLSVGADYGWNIREGLCATGVQIPCDTTPPAGVTNPAYAYNHDVLAGSSTSCRVITGGALPPAGWTGKPGSSYLFADNGCERIFEVTDLGGANTVSTFATGVGAVVDMIMVNEPGGASLYYTTYSNGGELHRIRSVVATTPAPQPGLGRLVPVVPTRVLDTRENLGASVGKPQAKSVTSFRLPAAVVPPEATAVAINLTGVAPAGPGFTTAWASGYPQPTSSNLNFAYAGETAANAAILPVGPGASVDLYTDTAVHLIVDVTGYWLPAATATAGRFTSTDPSRLLDTRSAVGVTAAGPISAGGKIELQVTGRGPVPDKGVSAVAMVVTAANPAAAGYVTVWPSDKPIPQASSLNPQGNDVRANLVIVPVSPSGKVSLFASAQMDLLADVSGWFTDTSADAKSSGLLQTITPARVLDTRDTRTPWSAGETRVAAIGPVGQPQGDFVYNLTAANTGGWGFLTMFPPGATLPTASNVNFERAGQNRAALAITRGKALAAGGPANASLYSFASTDVLIDAQAYFTV